jgi:hypothetical protein
MTSPITVRVLEDMPVSPRETATMPLRVADEPSTP